MTGTLIERFGPPWFRGPARRRGDRIVIDTAQGEWYDPHSERRVGVELARVRTPEDAVAFATRYGLLHSPVAETLKSEDDLPAELSEFYGRFAHEAEHLRRMMGFVLDAKAAAAGDAEAVSRLREYFSTDAIDETTRVGRMVDGVPMITTTLNRTYSPDQPPVDARIVIANALDFVSDEINIKLKLAGSVQVFAIPDPDALKLAVVLSASTLLGHCYLSVATAAAREPLARCEECQLPFVVEDGRQRYCTPTCGNRARQRRFKERALQVSPPEQTITKSQKGKARHGKTTRKGRR